MSDYDAVLLEDMNHKLDALLEGQQAMGHMPRKLDEIDERLGRVEADVDIIKLVVREHSKDIAEIRTDMKSVKRLLTGHDKRLVKLENAA